MINTCYMIWDSRYPKKFKFSDKFKTNFNKFIDLQDLKFDRYDKDKSNSHHWSFDFVYNVFLPILSGELDINFDISDYNKIDNIVQFEGNELDYSYLVPKEYKYEFYVHDMIKNTFFKGNFDILMSENVKTYHNVSILNHKVGKIHNLSLKNGRRLLLNCDSMSIPIIPILANYFEYIFVLDNRFGKTFKNEINNFKPTDKITILISGCDWKGNGAEKRYNNNLK